MRMDAQANVAYYKEQFNPMVFLKKFYGCDPSTIPACIKAELDILNEYFSSGKITGKRLLDVGTGPSFSTIITASRHFDEIYLSDISPTNLSFLNEWWAGKSFPLDHVIKYCLDIEKSSQTIAERNKEIRDKVNGIFAIDVQKSNPLTPNRLAVFDVIISGFCLECASSSREHYKIALSNVASLLKKNGKLVILGTMELPCYTIGNDTLQRAALSEKDINELYKETGFEVGVMKIFKGDLEPKSYDKFAMVAKKFQNNHCTNVQRCTVSALSNVASLLKKNGKLVILGTMELPCYTISNATLQRAALSEKDIHELYKETGFEVGVMQIFKSDLEPKSYDKFAILAKKVID